MRTRIAALAMTTLVVMFASGPAHLHGQTPPAATQDHEQHHPETKTLPAVATPSAEHNMMAMMAEMKATDAKLTALVAKMNTAAGAAKTEAMAELLTALVEARHAGCEAMMGQMMPMMQKMQMGGGAAHGMTAPATHPK